MKRCMYCGNENDDISQTCSKCGNRLLDLPPQQTMTAQEVPEDMTVAPEGSFFGNRNIRLADEDLDLEPLDDDPQLGQGAPSFFGEAGYGAPQDVQRGQTYAAGQQYGAQVQGGAYGGQPYGYPPAYGGGDVDVQQQYGGQAYGYQQAVPYGEPAPVPVQGGRDYGSVQQPAGGGKQLLFKARKAVKSPLFLLVILLNTLMNGASIANIVSANVIETMNAVQATIQSLLGSNMAVTFMNGLLDVVEGMNTMIILAVSLVLCIPGLLFCLGLWMIFFQTSNRADQVSTSGFTLTRVMMILKFIGYCILLTVGLIVSVAFVVAAGASSSVASVIVGVILLVIMIVISVLVVMFYVQLLYSIKVMRLNVRTGADPGRLPSFVPIMGIIGAIVTVMTMIPMSPDDILGLATQVLSAAWMLFGSIWLLVYRAKVRK